MNGAARKAKIRGINRGTAYDVPGKLRKLVHEIESGKHGDVTDVVLAFRTVKAGKTGIQTIYAGTSQPEVLHYMTCRLERDCMG